MSAVPRQDGNGSQARAGALPPAKRRPASRHTSADRRAGQALLVQTGGDVFGALRKTRRACGERASAALSKLGAPKATAPETGAAGLGSEPWGALANGHASAAQAAASATQAGTWPCAPCARARG